jgi:hypothetical protein
MPKIVGQLVDPQMQRPRPNLLVRASYRLRSRSQELLAQAAVSDQAGSFTLEFPSTLFAGVGENDAIDVAFQVSQNDRLLPSTGSIPALKDRNQRVVLDVIVAPEARDAVYTVSGRVASRTRAGVGGLRVEIVDKNVGGDLMLVEAVTDAKGAYRASFRADAFPNRVKQEFDLQARALSGTTLLGASEIRYDASTRETMHVPLTDAADADSESEYDTLIRSVAAHFPGSPGDLRETDDRQDLTYLAHKTGWDARAIAFAALAEQFSSRSAAADRPGIPAPLFYALFRAGLPADSSVYRTEPGRVAAIWKQGLARKVIPGALEGRIRQALETFERLSVNQALEATAPAGVSSLKALLAPTLRTAAEQRQFVELQVKHGPDRPAFWADVAARFGEARAKRLRVDSQLAALTINNGPLMRKLHQAAGPPGVEDPADLVEQGLYEADAWEAALGDDAVPAEIPGTTEAERRRRYAELLAAQVRLSYPTDVLAQMVRRGETPVAAQMADGVAAFLTGHRGSFEIGAQPIEQYVRRNNLRIEPDVVQEIARIERVRQITPNDQAMNALLQGGLDSAAAIARYPRDAFVRSFRDRLGGEANAAFTHAKAQQVHDAVLNIAMSYLIARTSPAIGVHSPAGILDPEPAGGAAATDVLAYPTLEGLFGSMDVCACAHCRSLLSPAAYLVDLLQFLEPADWAGELARWPADHGGARYPFAGPEEQRRFETDWTARFPGVDLPALTESPFDVLSIRRPDIQHLPLTCENTDTPLPYIDLVNEVLESFVANDVPLSLEGYAGHDTRGGADPEELQASPQFVEEKAYEILAGRRARATDPDPLLPPAGPLPFHRPLEQGRRYFRRFEAPLPRVLEALRVNDNLERPPAPAAEQEYGWRDILLEELEMSRLEADRGTAPGSTLAAAYGFASGTDADLRVTLSHAATFARRVGVSYDELVAILKTRFVNPHSILLPKLERLGLSFATLKAIRDGDAALDEPEELAARLPPDLDLAEYDGDVRQWVRDHYDRIMGLITLADPSGSAERCDFDRLEFRHANPDETEAPLSAFELHRMLRFVRLWRKLGWTIEQTDKALVALFPALADATSLSLLAAGLRVVLPRLGIVKRVLEALSLTAGRGLLPLLACFAPIDTHGERSLYRQMFLGAAAPGRGRPDPFAIDAYGSVPSGTGARLLAEKETLRAAFALTEAELTAIAGSLGFDGDTPLDLENMSAVFRRGWLARRLQLSVRELLQLIRCTGIDPFSAPDPPDAAETPPRDQAPILRLLALLDQMRAASLKPEQALYLIWNEDLSGRAGPNAREVLAFARTLRAGLVAVESDYAIPEAPDEDLARTRMAQVYGREATDFFFGLVGGSVVTEVPYAHDEPALARPILEAAGGRLDYDEFRKRLSHAGLLTETVRDALVIVPGVTPELGSALRRLFEACQDAIVPFFERYPELGSLHDTYVGSSASEAERRSTLLASLLPALEQRRKRQQALQAIGAAAKVEPGFVENVLDRREGDVYVLHAAGDDGRPALDDLTALEEPGLSVAWFFRDTATGAADLIRDNEANLAYAPDSNALPANPSGGTISGVWSGHLAAREDGFHNFQIAADAGATVTMTLDGEAVALAPGGEVWSNTVPIELRAGDLASIELKVENVRDRLDIRWETAGRGRETIPRAALFSATGTERLRAVYVRLLKVASIAAALRLTAREIAYLAARPDARLGGQSWLNRLPVLGTPDTATSAALREALASLLTFVHLKTRVFPGDERLLAVLKDPRAATETPDSLLFTLTRWEPASLDALLVRFGRAAGGLADRGALADLTTLRRIQEAFAWVARLQVSAAALAESATNEPTTETLRGLQAALRARYAEPDWLKVLRPINDEMRRLQRDALVAYILHQFRESADRRHIDTPEKLFEYFLVDVQMDPCMQTSRIRHAVSSVQLFVERCLMNLEPRVSPSAINARHWQWMKRFRVWEANRKIFLWPENWLEPELRLNQSPIFKETMSELLQSDITDDRAAAALGNYLAKLDEVAKLEPCGMYEEEGAADTANGVVHVVARTAGGNRKYFYRRLDSAGWSAWEEITVDIEDDPVIPVVWKGRLFLFWLRILKEAAVPTDPPFRSEGPLASITGSEINAAPPDITIKALLCWTERYNGKWQATRTSAVTEPTLLGTFDSAGPNPFDRTRARMHAYDRPNGLHVTVVYDGTFASGFLLYNTHSLPTSQENWSLDESIGFRVAARVRSVLTDADDWLSVRYSNVPIPGSLRTSQYDRVLLGNRRPDRAVEPTMIAPKDRGAPFLYADNRHVFYVTTREAAPSIQVGDGFVTAPVPGRGPSLFYIPPLAIDVDPAVFRERLGGPGPSSPAGRVGAEDPRIKISLTMAGTVPYGDKEIGLAGGVGPRLPERT